MTTQKNKHMSLDDRLEIENCLYQRMTFKQIAAPTGKGRRIV